MLSMYGVRSELFVAMNSRGRLYGTVGVRNCISLYCWHAISKRDGEKRNVFEIS